MNIGLCGTGDMGSAIAERLLAVGHRVTVWNRTPAKAEPLIEHGAIRAVSPAALVSSNDIVLTCLLNDAAVEEVYDGPNGLLAAERCTGALFIDTSTVRADTLEGVCARARAKGAVLLECPVAGAPQMARAGRLMGFAGGQAAGFARAQPVLAEFCQDLGHYGPLGCGNAMKLAINLPLLVYFAALGEALSLVRDVPVEPSRIIAALANSPGGANAMKIIGPMLAEAWTSGREPAGFFPLGGVRKDGNLMLDAAKRQATPLPILGAALASYDEATAAGWGARPVFAQALYARSTAPAR